MSITSQIRYVQALDTTSTTGAGKSGLAFGDITAKYLTQGGTLTSLTTETITTLGAYQAPTSAAHIRIKELAGTDPTIGIYEVHFHNTQVAASGKRLWAFFSATGARFQPLEMDLIPYLDADSTSSTDFKDLVDTGYDPSVHRMSSDVNSFLGTTLTESGAGRVEAGFKKFFDVATPASTMELLTAVVSVQGMTAAGWAGAFTIDTTKTYVDAVAGSVVKEIASNAGGGGLTQADVRAAVGLASANLDTQLAGILSHGDSTWATATGFAIAGDAMTLSSAYDFAKGTAAMTESYAADGAAPTPAQAFFMIWSILAEKSVSGVTMTTKKLDGTTSAMTFTLDDATTPSSITRAS